MRRSFLLVPSVAILLGACGTEPSSSAGPVASTEVSAEAGCREGATLRVMTQNLYLGADIVPLVDAPADQIVQASTKLWETVRRTHFPARAQVIADEVRANLPDVLGLQEVTTWRTGDPVVCATGNPNDTQATKVAYDYLAILLRALRERGLDYEVVAQTTTMDAEVCIGDPANPTTLSDLRYTDHDVLLVRRGVAWRTPAVPPAVPGFVAAPIGPGPGDLNGGVYAAALTGEPVPATACFLLAGNTDPATAVCSYRGWTETEVRKGGQWVRIFESHPEDWLDTPAGVPQWIFQGLQVIQLVALLDGAYAESPLPTLALGDFNAYVTLADRPPVYEYLIGDGADLEAALAALVGGPVTLPPSPLADAWTALHPGDPGYTWGFDELLYTGTLSTRLDLVLGTPDLTPLFMKRVGTYNRTWAGQHPSDHAGLVAIFAVP